MTQAVYNFLYRCSKLIWVIILIIFVWVFSYCLMEKIPNSFLANSHMYLIASYHLLESRRLLKVCKKQDLFCVWTTSFPLMCTTASNIHYYLARRIPSFWLRKVDSGSLHLAASQCASFRTISSHSIEILLALCVILKFEIEIKLFSCSIDFWKM